MLGGMAGAKKKLIAVIAPSKPVSEMSDEELDALTDFVTAQTRSAVGDETDQILDDDGD